MRPRGIHDNRRRQGAAIVKRHARNPVAVLQHVHDTLAEDKRRAMAFRCRLDVPGRKQRVADVSRFGKKQEVTHFAVLRSEFRVIRCLGRVEMPWVHDGQICSCLGGRPDFVGNADGVGDLFQFLAELVFFETGVKTAHFTVGGQNFVPCSAQIPREILPEWIVRLGKRGPVQG